MALSNSFGGSKKMLDEGLGVAADPLALLSEELDKMWGVSAPPKEDLESDPVRDLSESYRSESLRKMSDEELMARIQKREALKAAEQERQTALRSMSNEDLMARIEARKKSPMGALEYLRKSAEAKGVVWDGDTPDLKKSFDATLMAQSLHSLMTTPDAIAELKSDQRSHDDDFSLTDLLTFSRCR